MLYQIFLNNTEKVAHKWVHYFPIYERYLKNYINQSIFMIEIGVNAGGSLQLWKKYLGPFAKIVGIDINNNCKKHEDEQIKIRIGSQSDTTFLDKIIQEFGCPNIVIDDGSHIMNDMSATFEYLYPKLQNNGVYIVEDCHTCYWDRYGGGLGKSDSFIEKAKNMVDKLNEYYFKNDNQISEFAKSTFSISFYDSMVVIEKMDHTRPYALKKP